ncbi:flavin reductase family protein [Saxibacter everestensis]|uniref:Flavin reductase family protein n=1 Tax=Saxibacter everestensis TaxID=2909229 RepID=A0ABY8QXA3_9MICO|nr:flavin reductase family protein [Brevibacteriaceae bacterium ZFBP1038]
MTLSPNCSELDTSRPTNAEQCPVTPDLFRGLFRQHGAGVAIVTASIDGQRAGFTATSLVSVSAEPPVIAFNISQRSSSWRVIAGQDYVGVHILAKRHEPLATRFATSGIDRFAGVGAQAGPHAVPILRDVDTWMVARIRNRIPHGDSSLVIAQVTDAVVGETAEAPLLYQNGRYLDIADDYQI